VEDALWHTEEGKDEEEKSHEYDCAGNGCHRMGFPPVFPREKREETANKSRDRNGRSALPVYSHWVLVENRWNWMYFQSHGSAVSPFGFKPPVSPPVRHEDVKVVQSAIIKSLSPTLITLYQTTMRSSDPIP
jgi:hypothetical protein